MSTETWLLLQHGKMRAGSLSAIEARTICKLLLLQSFDWRNYKKHLQPRKWIAWPSSPLSARKEWKQVKPRRAWYYFIILFRNTISAYVYFFLFYFSFIIFSIFRFFHYNYFLIFHRLYSTMYTINDYWIRRLK